MSDHANLPRMAPRLPSGALDHVLILERARQARQAAMAAMARTALAAAARLLRRGRAWFGAAIRGPALR